jgi:hypothetical protein
MWCDCVDQVHLVQDRVELWVVLNTVMSLAGSIGGGEFLDQLSDSVA